MGSLLKYPLRGLQNPVEVPLLGTGGSAPSEREEASSTCKS